METITTIYDLRQQINAWQSTKECVAFVPTMGNLHAGHLKLIEVAHEYGTRVIASIFVNPLQFQPGTDFEHYPRTLQQDAEKLQRANVHCLFAPSTEEMYADAETSKTHITVAGLSEILCGYYRPGHFEGVTTVVGKLFNLVQPQLAIFGEKDFQQLLIIRQMVKDLCFPIQLVGVPTMREADGLAMSSRNQYLTQEERVQASQLYQTLLEVKNKVEINQAAFNIIENQAMNRLQRAGFQAEYVNICQPEDLQPGQLDSQHLRVLAAAWLGEARLIDNLELR